MLKSKILLIMTGSISCYKVCTVISKLRQMNYDVQVVATESALQFVGKATLEGLCGNPVLSDLWTSGQAMDHIELVRNADLILVAPASASFINKMAAGIGDDLASTLCLAHNFKKPFLIAPAMNSSMYLHPATQSSLKKLDQWGLKILPTNTGSLACGESGEGRLLEPEEILNSIEAHLTPPIMRPSNSSNLKHKSFFRVLVTSGGTQEPIDAVRVLTNRSTGSTGTQIATQLAKKGVNVTLLRAATSILPTETFDDKLEVLNFNTFKDLYSKMHDLIKNKNFDVIIHAAAVSDFSIIDESLLKRKMKSQNELTLNFKANPKIVNEIKTWAPQTKLVAFKMTAENKSDHQKEAVRRLFSDSQADFIVHNDIAEIPWGDTEKVGPHQFHWYRSEVDLDNNTLLKNVTDLANTIVNETLGETL